ncbi:MAG: thiamine phosphate synthase [Defluviitaleaceae bacterium]|nr:thiamine phosphate synthase [Defluviitaleaceae bacterium]
MNYSLYLVTDENICEDLEKAVEEAIIGGVTIVQLREKNKSSRKFYEKAVKIREITKKYNTPLIINDRVDIAYAVEADGVHLGQDDLDIKEARKIMGNKIIGISTNFVSQAIKAEKAGADYIGVGAVFKTNTKENSIHIGIEGLKEIKEAVKIPIVAIGGINELNISEIKNIGVQGYAIVSAILAKEDKRLAAENLKKACQPG